MFFIPTLRQTKPRERPEAAICVRKSSARRVLQFTPLNAASCVLHRPANRVIHRLQSFFSHFCLFIALFSMSVIAHTNAHFKWHIHRLCQAVHPLAVLIESGGFGLLRAQSHSAVSLASADSQPREREPNTRVDRLAD